MKIKNKAAVALLAISMCNALAFAQGIVYYPTYQDGTANVYEYNPYNQYKINTTVRRVTDIQLRHGEQVQKIAAGDSVQWKVDTDIVNGIQHVYVKPIYNGIQTNFIINTNKRSYRFILNSNANGEYIVLFTYPKEDAAEAHQKDVEELQKIQRETAIWNAISQTKLSYPYAVTKNKNVDAKYIPESIFTDGKKTFIKLSKASLEHMPTLYTFDEWDKDKLQLVNYRLKDSLLEVDRAIDKMKIVFSQNSYLLVKKEVKEQIPNPKDIHFSRIDLETLFRTQIVQAEEIPLQQTFVPLKERIHQLKIQEAKDMIAATQKQQEIDTTLLDEKIASLEKELNQSQKSDSSSEDSDPELQQRIATIYEDTKV